MAIPSISAISPTMLNCSVEVFGRIKGIRNLGKIRFCQIYDDSGICQVVIEPSSMTPPNLHTFDHIRVTGIVSENHGSLEIRAAQICQVGTANRFPSPKAIEYEKLQKLALRSKAISAMNKALTNESFLPVTSPTIVGSWVEGNTKTFEVSYFGEQRYLTLNSMLYHQILLISGYTRIFEFSKIFRQDGSSPKDRLAEFTSLDISMSHSSAEVMMQLVESLISNTYQLLKDQYGNRLIDSISFRRISYDDLLKAIGMETTGAQLPAKAKEYLELNYDCFVWVYGFPEEKRRFFVKAENGICKDYQLWYRGRNQIAAGSERESSLDVLAKKIANEGKKIENYQPLLEYFKAGVPPMCEIGFGFERFMMNLVRDSVITDFVAFPRNKKHFAI